MIFKQAQVLSTLGTIVPLEPGRADKSTCVTELQHDGRMHGWKMEGWWMEDKRKGRRMDGREGGGKEGGKKEK